MRPQQPFPSGTTERMEQLLKLTHSLDEYRHLQSIYFRSKYEFSAQQIADMVGLKLQTIRNIHSAFLREGEAALQTKPMGGRRQTRLSLEEEEALLATFQVEGQLGRILAIHRVWQAYQEKVGQPVAKSTVYRLLYRHGWRKLAPRPHHPQGDEKRSERFKKTSVDSSGVSRNNHNSRAYLCE